MCNECVDTDGVNIQRSGEHTCGKCPDPLLNVLRLSAFVVGLFIFLWILIFFNMKKKGESNHSVLSRIFTNYF